VVAENGSVDPFAHCENPRFNQTWRTVGFARIHVCWATGANTCNAVRSSYYCDGTTPLPAGAVGVYCSPPSAVPSCPGNPGEFGGAHPTVAWNPACPFPAGGLPCSPQSIFISNECEVVQRNPQPVGCGFFGMLSPRPQLVRDSRSWGN
jgi:hypothetical protein